MGVKIIIDKKLILKILKDQVKPALGCTEPGAVAYAVARAREILNEDVKKINISVDKNILKNGLVVGIPGTEEKGIIFAAALSLIIGKSRYLLEVIKDVTDKAIEEAANIIDSNIIHLDLNKEVDDLYIRVDAVGKKNESRVIIKNSHTNIVFESRNDEILLDKEEEKNEEDTSTDKKENEIRDEIKKYSFDEIIEFVYNVSIEDISFIQDGINMNMRMAEVGLSEDLATSIGKSFYNTADDLISKAKAYTIAASEARMSGFPLPVMSSAGSGNHGLVAIIPASYMGSAMDIAPEKILRAVTLSHLVTIYIKAHIGTLSPICGCGVAAGVGCSSALTYLQKGSKEQIKASISNMIAGVSGMICDGAKLGCAYKLGISVNAAADATYLALNNHIIPADNGILGETAEKSVENLAKVSKEGMNNTDDSILDIMLAKTL